LKAQIILINNNLQRDYYFFVKKLKTLWFLLNHKYIISPLLQVNLNLEGDILWFIWSKRLFSTYYNFNGL